MDTTDSKRIFLYDYLTFLIAALILYIQGLFGWSILLVCLEVLAVWAYFVFVVNEGKPFREHDNENVIQNVTSPTIQNNIESVEWLNAAVAKMWPKVKANIEENLKTEVTNALKMKPWSLACVKIKQFDIGKKPPQFNGILNQTKADSPFRVDNQIVFDLDTDFSGSDCVFRLKLICCCLGIKNVSIRGRLRAELNQLTDESPYVGSISFYFLTEPEFDYKYVKYKELLKAAQVKTIIKNFIKNNFVYPNKFIFTFPEEEKNEEIQTMNVQADSSIVHSDRIRRENRGSTNITKDNSIFMKGKFQGMNVQSDSSIVHSDGIRRANMESPKIAKDNLIINKVGFKLQGMKVRANSSIVHSDGISQANLGIPKKITKVNSSSSNVAKRVNLRGYCCAFHLHYHETKRRAKFYRTSGIHKLSGHKPNY